MTAQAYGAPLLSDTDMLAAINERRLPIGAPCPDADDTAEDHRDHRHGHWLSDRDQDGLARVRADRDERGAA